MPINFATTSDDGSMLYIDGNAVVNNNNFQPPAQATGMADLTPGLHTIDVEYYQGGGGATLDVQWDPTGGTNFVDIPNSAFVASVNGLIKTGTGTLTVSNTSSYSGTTTIKAGTLQVGASNARSQHVRRDRQRHPRPGWPSQHHRRSRRRRTVTSSAAGSVTLTVGYTNDGNFGGVIEDGSGTVARQDAAPAPRPSPAPTPTGASRP